MAQSKFLKTTKQYFRCDKINTHEKYKKSFYYALGISFVSALFYGFFIYHQLQVWKYEGPDVKFRVRAGESFSKINYRLKKDGLISNSTIFYRLAKLKNLVTRIRVGEHTINTNSNMINIITLLTAGPGSDISITIPEGKKSL